MADAAFADTGDDYAPTETEDQRKQRLTSALSTIAGRLENLAAEQQSRKKNIEERWLEDLRQYHGRYSVGVEKALRDAKKSRVFANLTRSKTLAWAARLSDMLYPVDDKPWSISPTPVPELSQDAQRAVEEANAAVQEANIAVEQAQQTGDQQAEQAAVGRAEQAAAKAKEAQLALDEVRRRSNLMSDEMEDQLRECQYNIKSREGITTMCRIGTQVMKGPILGERRRKQWRKMQLQEGGTQQPIGPGNFQQGTEWELREVGDPNPVFDGVNPWLFYPEMVARTVEEAEFTFELHPLTKKNMQNLAKRDDFDTDAIRECVREGIQGTLPDWWPKLREIADNDNFADTKRFLVWEYHGPLEEDDVRNLIHSFDKSKDQGWIKEFEADPLTQLNVIVWFCQGRVIKFGMHPLDRGDTLYSVTPFEKDDASMFGFSIPSILRNAQAIKSGAWRMMMDNAALAAGVNVFLNRKKVSPADGKWEIAGKKIWWITEDLAPNEKIADQLKIEVRQNELERIAALADEMADMEVSMPLVAMGEQAGHVTTGQQGLALLINSANVIFRHATRNYDDHHTTPNIRRLYDWNMQHNERDEIKGDMEVDARGSSVLLVREMQSQNLMLLLRLFGTDPVLGPYLKSSKGLSILVQTLSLRADELVKTDQEVADEDAERKKNAEPPIEIQLQREKQQHEKDLAEYKATAEKIATGAKLEAALIQLAEKHNITLDQLRSQLQQARETLASKERTEKEKLQSKERLAATQIAVEKPVRLAG